MIETKVNWRSIKKVGYPSVEEFGPEPIVFVVLTLIDESKAKFRSLYTLRRPDSAQLKFIGEEKIPYWVKPNSLMPIEDDCWKVTHWIPYLSEPVGD